MSYQPENEEIKLANGWVSKNSRTPPTHAFKMEDVIEKAKRRERFTPENWVAVLKDSPVRTIDALSKGLDLKPSRAAKLYTKLIMRVYETNSEPKT